MDAALLDWQTLPCGEMVLRGGLMTTMNVSIPDSMKQWVEQQTQSGQYANASDYMRHLIRRDQERMAKIAHVQALVTEGIRSGPGRRSMAALKKAALAQVKPAKKTSR